MTESNDPSRRSRWFQFGLRTLFALTMLAGAYFAGFATAQKLAEKAIRDAQQRATQELETARQNAQVAEERAAEARALADEAMSWAARDAARAGSKVPSR